jgi:hypothetical protein
MMPSNEGMRITPQIGAENYKTYQMLVPLQTHWNVISCELSQCAQAANGWVSLIDESTDLGTQQAYYIRKQSGRKFTESRTPEGLTRFEFPGGQECFATHRVRKEEVQEIFVVRDGDWRGNPLGTQAYRHTHADYWIEDFAEHQQKIADQIGQG